MTKSKRSIARALFRDSTISEENSKKINCEFVEKLLSQEENYFKERYQIICRKSPSSPLTVSSGVSLTNLSLSTLPSGANEIISSSPGHLPDAKSIPHPAYDHITSSTNVIDKLVRDEPASRNRQRSLPKKNLVRRTANTPCPTSLASRHFKRYRLACIDGKSPDQSSTSLSIAFSSLKDRDSKSSNCENCISSAVRSFSRKKTRPDEIYHV